jgi:hypothetical protein
MITKVSKRAHVTLTTILDVSDVPDIVMAVPARTFRPDQVTIKYDYAPADDFTETPYHDKTITVYGRYVLKSGGLGKDRHRVVFYGRTDVPDWVREADEASTPDWDQLALPGK